MEDISKEVVAVVLVIAIVISVLGTWLVLDNATSFRPGGAGQNVVSGKSNIGKVGGNIGVTVLQQFGATDTENSNIAVKLIK